MQDGGHTAGVEVVGFHVIIQVDVQLTDLALDLYLRDKDQAEPIHANGFARLMAGATAGAAGAVMETGFMDMIVFSTLVLPGITGLYIVIAMVTRCAVLCSSCS